MRYGCQKITRCNEDTIRIEKLGSTWANTTWDGSKLKCKGNEISKEKKPSIFAQNSVLYEWNFSL
jgi:hypothetical protein